MYCKAKKIEGIQKILYLINWFLLQKLFKGENYSREETIDHYEVLTAETIQGRKLFKGGNYSRKYGTSLLWAKGISSPLFGAAGWGISFSISTVSSVAELCSPVGFDPDPWSDLSNKFRALSWGHSSWLLDLLATLMAIPSKPHSHILKPNFDSSLRWKSPSVESSSSEKDQLGCLYITDKETDASWDMFIIWKINSGLWSGLDCEKKTGWGRLWVTFEARFFTFSGSKF